MFSTNSAVGADNDGLPCQVVSLETAIGADIVHQANHVLIC